MSVVKRKRTFRFRVEADIDGADDLRLEANVRATDVGDALDNLPEDVDDQMEAVLGEPESDERQAARGACSRLKLEITRL